MKTRWQLRAFGVQLLDVRTGHTTEERFVTDKATLQAAELVGESANELITRHYTRQGFSIIRIDKPERREVILDLAELFDRP